MVDYRRMEWQFRANKIATVAMLVLIVFNLEEVGFALKYHFPWWDDVMMSVTFPLNMLAAFVKRHTDMYRVDL